VKLSILKKFLNKIFHFMPRKLAQSPILAAGNFTSVLINKLTQDEKHFLNYLEIGTQFGWTLEAVDMPYKIGIDPNPKHSLKFMPPGVKSLVMTSDEYFAAKNDLILFDFIYIDGLHVFQTVYRDFVNSVNCLSEGGIILIDDVIPVDVYSADINQTRAVTERKIQGNISKAWQGDVYKLLKLIATEIPFLELKTIIYPSNAQALIKFKGPKQNLEFDRELFIKYDNLTFQNVFANFQESSLLFHFEFGWNV